MSRTRQRWDRMRVALLRLGQDARDSRLRFQRAKHVWWWTHVRAEASVQKDLIKPHRGIQRGQPRNSWQHWMIQRMEMWMIRISGTTSFRSDLMKQMSVLSFWQNITTEWLVRVGWRLPSDAARPRWTDQNVCEGLKCGKAERKPQSVLAARMGSGKHGWSTVEHEVQSGKVCCWGNDRLWDRIRCNTVGGEWGNTQTQTQDNTMSREQGRTRCTSDCTSSVQDTEWRDSGSSTQTSGRHARGRRHERKGSSLLSNATDPQHVKAVLGRLESEAAFSAMSVTRVEASLVGACEAFRPTDRTRLNEMRAVQNTVSDTPKASRANAERIERASQMVEKRSRTSRPWFEGMTVERVCKVMPDTVRNCAWQTSRRLTRPGRAKQNEASRRHNRQVSKFTKMNHFTDGEWNLRLWRNADLVPRGHWKCKLARVCRCRIVWRCPENQRWDRKLLTEMNGEPWNTSSRQEEKLQIKDRECIALKHLIKCGGQ